MRDLSAAMDAVKNIKNWAKKSMVKKGIKEEENEQHNSPEDAKKDMELDYEDNAVPGGSASKVGEDSDMYGDSRLPETLEGLDDKNEDDDITVVLMSGRKAR